MRGDRPQQAHACCNPEPATPHARGSTSLALLISPLIRGYPACAGIDLENSVSTLLDCWLPRMRGDRPQPQVSCAGESAATPHARGSTLHSHGSCVMTPGYPACAGIDPAPGTPAPPRLRLPRMRGDRPLVNALRRGWLWATPHARGSTVIPDSLLKGWEGYPACAGIDLSRSSMDAPPIWLPRMRGDRPGPRSAWWRRDTATPHARGSTSRGRVIPWGSGGYPACAGIDLWQGRRRYDATGLPRMRGDRPLSEIR